MIVRCWPRLACGRHGPFAEAHDEVVTLRPDERDAVPELLLPHVGEAASVGGFERRGIRDASLSGPPRRPSASPRTTGRRHRHARRRGRRHRGAARSARRARRPAPAAPRSPARRWSTSCSSQNAIPSTPVSSRRMARSSAFRCASTRASSTRSRATRRSRWARIASRNRRRSPGEPTRRSISSGRNRTARTTSPIDDERRGEAVHAHPLAEADRRLGSRQDRFHARAVASGRVDEVEPDAGVRCAMLDELGLDRGARRAPGDRHHDRLEQVRLARPVGAGDDRQAGLEVQLGARIAAEVLERQAGQAHRSGPHRCGRRGRQEAVRTGMMTCT